MAIGYRPIGTFNQATTGPTIGLPAGTTAGDLLLLFIHTANEAVTITSPSGYTQLTNSPVSTGTAAAAGGVRLTAFWKIAGAGEANVVLSDSGSVTGGVILAVTGHDPVTPIHATSSGIQATASTAWTTPSLAVTGTRPKGIIWALGLDRDLNVASGNITAFTNATFASPVILEDETTNTGAGGGLGIVTSMPATITSGTVATSSVTSAASTTAVFLTIAVNEAIPPIDLFANSTVSVTATQPNINTSIRLAAAATMSITSNQPELITPFTLLYADSSLGLTSSAALTTQIRLAASSTASVTAAAPNITTSIRFAGNSTASITGSATLYNYATFAANSNLGLTSSGTISTQIRFAANSTSSISSNTPILGSEHKFYSNSTLSITANNPTLRAIAVFYANSIVGVTSSASLATGVLFAANSTLSIRSLALLLPTWQPSGMVFDGGKVYSYATPMRFVGFQTASRKVVYAIPDVPIFYGDIRGFRYNVDHTYKFTTPIIRV